MTWWWVVLPIVAVGALLVLGLRRPKPTDQDCAVAEEDAHLPEVGRMREVYVGADADEAELKRRYGEDVVIHRSDR